MATTVLVGGSGSTTITGGSGSTTLVLPGPAGGAFALNSPEFQAAVHGVGDTVWAPSSGAGSPSAAQAASMAYTDVQIAATGVLKDVIAALGVPSAIADDFARPDRDLKGDISATGQRWWIDFDPVKTLFWIEGQRAVRHRKNTDGAGSTGAAPILMASLESVPTTVAGIVMFVPSQTGTVAPADQTSTNDVVVGCCPQTFGAGSVQLAITPGDAKSDPKWSLFTSGPNPTDGHHENITYGTGSFPNARLKQDGLTPYLVMMRMDLATSTITCTTPWGTFIVSDGMPGAPANPYAVAGQATVPGQLAAWWGGNVGFQHRHYKATDGESQFAAVAAGPPAAPPLPVSVPAGGTPTLYLPARNLQSYVRSDPLDPAYVPSGNFDVRGRMSADLWAGNGLDGTVPNIPAAQQAQTLCAIWDAKGNQRVMQVQVATNKRLTFRTSSDGKAATQSTSQVTTAVPVADGAWMTWRITRVANDGSGNTVTTFYTSTDVDPDTDNWTQLGAAVVQAAPSPVYTPQPSTLGIQVGACSENNTVAYPLRGRVSGCVVYDGIKGQAGTVLLGNLDCRGVWSQFRGTNGAYVGAAGRIWTIAGGGPQWVWGVDNVPNPPSTVAAYKTQISAAAAAVQTAQQTLATINVPLANVTAGSVFDLELFGAHTAPNPGGAMTLIIKIGGNALASVGIAVTPTGGASTSGKGWYVRGKIYVDTTGSAATLRFGGHAVVIGANAASAPFGMDGSVNGRDLTAGIPITVTLQMAATTAGTAFTIDGGTLVQVI